jgi:inorganic pyrophosphatase
VHVPLDAAVYGKFQLEYPECILKCGVVEVVGMVAATAVDAKIILVLRVDTIMQK